MIVTHSPDSSRILLAYFLLTLIGSSVDTVRREEGSDLSAQTTNLQNRPKIHIETDQQEKVSSSPLVTVHESSTPHLLKAFDNQGKPWKIDPKNLDFHLVDFKMHKFLTYKYTETLINEITKSVLISGHSNRARQKREAKAEAPNDPQNVTTTSLKESSSNMYTDGTTDQTLKEMSTIGNMYLCEHPPKTFSPSFHGSLKEACLHYDPVWKVSFRHTREVCDSVYSLSEANPETLNMGLYQSKRGPLYIISHKSYVRICLPLFRRFNKCEERKYLTICWDDRVVFFHSNICPQSSNDIYLAGFLLKNDEECFHEFCEGRQSVVDGEIGGVLYRLTNTRHSSNAPSCGYMTTSLKHIRREYNGTLYMFFNYHWPCCYPLYLVIWAGFPEDHGLNGAWSYLPAACQAGEVLLLVLVGCIMVGSIGGNLIVLMVMLNGGHHSQESSLFRTSLAFANLLTATFVIVPSFVRHLSPFFSTPNYITLRPNMKLIFELPVNSSSYIFTTNHINKEFGFSLFQSLLFHITSTASLLTLLILSVERFIITGRYLKYKDYFSYCRAMVVITISWTTSLVNALWFAADDDGGFSTQWLTFEKLPTGASGDGPGGVRNIIYHGQFVTFLILGISVVTFSALAIKNFIKEQMHVTKEWRSLKMKSSKRYRQDNRHVLTTMTLMLVLFLISTLPLATHILFSSIMYTFRQQALFAYLAWWLFMSGCAWNPWVYNFRSHQFKEDLTNFQHQIVHVWRGIYVEESQTMSNTSLPCD